MIGLAQKVSACNLHNIPMLYREYILLPEGLHSLGANYSNAALASLGMPCCRGTKRCGAPHDTREGVKSGIVHGGLTDQRIHYTDGRQILETVPWV